MLIAKVAVKTGKAHYMSLYAIYCFLFFLFFSYCGVYKHVYYLYLIGSGQRLLEYYLTQHDDVYSNNNNLMDEVFVEWFSQWERDHKIVLARL